MPPMVMPRELDDERREKAVSVDFIGLGAMSLGLSTLVWAVNEEIPCPRRIAGAVRIVIMFVALVAAADYLDFARGVFLAAFIILLGGSTLAASLAIGLGGRDAAKRYLELRKAREEESGARSLWTHL